MRLGQTLRDLDPAAPTVATPRPRPSACGSPPALRARRARGEGRRPLREALALAPRRPRSTWMNPDPVEAEALEPDRARAASKASGSLVRHGDVEGDPLHVLGRLCAADGAVMVRAAVGRADDERLAQSNPQRLQGVERRLVHEKLAGAAAGDLGGMKSASARPPQARRASGCRKSWVPRTKKARQDGGGGGSLGMTIRRRRSVGGPKQNGPLHGVQRASPTGRCRAHGAPRCVR